MSDSDLEVIHRLQPAAITIPESRQRKKAEADETLISSIQAVGVLNPIICKRTVPGTDYDFVLVAGERRLDACRKLKILVPVRFLDELPPLDAFRIELQENMARKQLTWQEEAAAIHDYHKLRSTDFPGWTMLGTGTDLGISESTVSRAITVAAELSDPNVSGCQTISAALNYIQARANRTIAAARAQGYQFSDTVRQLFEKPTVENATAALIAQATGAAPPAAAPTTTLSEAAKQAAEFLAARKKAAPAAATAASQIIHADFTDWAASYADIPFDVIHCDFPYGKNWSGSNTSRQAELNQPIYDDRPEVMLGLLDTLLRHQDRICAPQAHVFFWMAMEHYQEIIFRFIRAGWALSSPYPCVWTKGNQGAPGDYARNYRHCYETALLFRRGDRNIVRMVQDHFAAAGAIGEDKLHLSQKPVPMIQHFLSALCDEHTRLLDPTCGSGSAIAAANLLQVDYAIGIERDADNVDIARLLVDRKVAEEGR